MRIQISIASIFAIMAIFILGVTCPVRGEEPDETESPVDAAQFAHSQLTANLQSLRSGICRARGQLTESYPNRQRLERDLELLFVVDVASRQLRIDRMESNVQLVTSSGVKHENFSNSAIWISTPEHTWYRAAGGRSELTRNRPGMAVPQGIRPVIDPRTISFSFFGELSIPFEERLRMLKGAFALATEVESQGEDVRQVRLVSDKQAIIRMNYACDTKRGYSPVHTEVELQIGDDVRKLLDTATTYEEHAGVWLPATCELVDKSGRELTLSLSLEWERVNEEIDPALFQWESLSVDVVDLTPEKSNPDHVGSNRLSDQTTLPELPTAKSLNSDGHVVLYAATALIGGGTILLYRQRLGRRSRQDGGARSK